VPDALAHLQSTLADRYQIHREVGSGGMATVYLATDLRHHRNVAIKVLRPELAPLVGAERFLREVTTTAQLQHPHILPLFDSGSEGGFLYYVMPFIDGETLRHKLDRERQLSVDDAVRIASEVADALDYAHRQGVVHRDIKPENILLHDGRATVADFGIALALGGPGSRRMTDTGIAVGTPSYMSPEQATADREVTPRSDIYALGAVLYEMLCGSPPHVAPTAQQLVMKIVSEEAPRVSGVRKTVPPHVSNAVAVALEKVPGDRFDRARAFAEALHTPGFTREASSPVQMQPARRSRWFAGAAVLAALAVGTWLGRALVHTDPPHISRFAIVLPDSGAFNPAAGVNIVWSPDGTHIVYVGRSQNGRDRLWQRLLDQMVAQPIAGTDAGRIPTFSPDGATLAFVSGGALRTVSMQGGPPLTIVPQGVPSAAGGLAWGDNDRLYYVNVSGAIVSIAPAGGPTTTIAAPNADAGYMWIDALPGGHALLATVGRLGVPEASEIVVVPTDGGAVRRLLKGTMARYASSGHLVFATADGALMAAPFDAKRAEVTGATVPLLQGVDVYMGSASQFALSRSGGLLWVGYGGLREIVQVDRRGVPMPIDSGWAADIRNFAVSPDGTRLALTTAEMGKLRIGIKPMGRAPMVSLAVDGTRTAALAWSADGRQLVVLSERAGVNGLWMVPADGTEQDRSLPLTGNIFSAEWSVDGTAMVAARAIPGARTEIVSYQPSVDSAARTIVSGAHLMQYAQIAPNKRWLAYSGNETGQDQVYLRAFPQGSSQWQVTSQGGIEPAWSPDGRELFYRDPSGMLMAVAVSADDTGAPRVGAPRALFKLTSDDNTDGRHYHVMPDGQHFVVLQPVGSANRDVMVVQNFVEELRQKVRR
jgi:serine/threonine-protein kinase